MKSVSISPILFCAVCCFAIQTWAQQQPPPQRGDGREQRQDQPAGVNRAPEGGQGIGPGPGRQVG